jgi:hypothetical protein
MRICPLIDMLSTFLNEPGEPLPGWVESHVGECNRCRAKRETELRLGRTLSGRPTSLEPTPFLHARIMRSIDDLDGETTAPVRASGMRWLGGLATALGVVAISVTVFLNERSPETVTGVVTDRIADAAGEIFKTMPISQGRSVEEWTATFSQDPLEDEMQRALDDARAAVNSLADSFLPEQFKDSFFIASAE